MGTPRYMAPEILAGTIGNENNALLRSDVYALALVLWELLSRCQTLGNHFSFFSLFVQEDVEEMYSDPYEKYSMPYEEQLKEKGIDGNPSIDQMLEIVNSEGPSSRPLIRSSWRKSSIISEKLLRTIEQCWDSTPEGRINASLVAHRLNIH